MSEKTLFLVIIILLAITGGYFYVTKNHMVTTQMPGDQSAMTNADVEGFVRHDFAKVLTIDSRQTEDERVEQASPYMTDAGLKDLRKNFLKSGWMKSTERTDVTFIEEPKVTGEAGDGWAVKSKIKIDFVGGGAKRSQDFVVALNVVKKDLNGEQTLGIDKMKLVPVKK